LPASIARRSRGRFTSLLAAFAQEDCCSRSSRGPRSLGLGLMKGFGSNIVGGFILGVGEFVAFLVSEPQPYARVLLMGRRWCACRHHLDRQLPWHRICSAGRRARVCAVDPARWRDRRSVLCVHAQANEGQCRRLRQRWICCHHRRAAQMVLSVAAVCFA
jgi:hypothetical protein